MAYINKTSWNLLVCITICFVSSVSADRVFRPPDNFFLNIPPFAQRDREEKKSKKEKKELEKLVEKIVQEKEFSSRAGFSPRGGNAFDARYNPQITRNNQGESGMLPTSFSREMQSLLMRQYSDLELAGKKVSLTFKDADIRDALELISRSIGINFLIDSDIEGTVRSVHFVDAPVSIVLRHLLQGNVPKLALIKDCGLFRITKLAGAKNILADQEESDFEFAIIPILNTISSKGRKSKIEKMWRGIVGSSLGKPGFYLVFDEDSKKIFCRAKRYHIAYFKKFLQEVDSLVPQVKIEARFVCAEKGFEENIGFQWSGIYNRRASVGRGFHFIGCGQPLSDISNNPKPQTAGALVDWALNFLPTPAKAAKALSLPFVFGGNNLNTRRLNLVLNAAEDRNEIKTILKPSILASDGELAEILVGENVPIERIIDESIDGRRTHVRTAIYKDIGIQLKVKPAVLANNKSVLLDVFIENSQQSDSLKSGRATYPVIRTTRSTTRVRLKSGETTMISGLIKDVKENYKTAAPLLSELPLIGWLFRGSRKRKQDMQLLIFITATVF